MTLTKPCREWTGRRGRNGYGRVYFEGTRWAAHRLVWWLLHGNIPEGLEVCHHCDNRACFEITHLFLGTRLENQRDAVKKDRHARGTRCGHAKLTDQDILDIRAAIAAGETNLSISKRYPVNDASISNIRSGHTWKHVKGQA